MHMNIPVLYEDNHLLVVDKPAGMASQADGHATTDLLSELKDYIKLKYDKPGDVYLGLVHRLDQPVSGIMVFARTSKAAARLSEQVRDRVFKKTYRAVLMGSPPEMSGTLKHYIWKDDTKNKVVVYNKPGADAKPAILHYTVVKKDKETTTVEIELETGRPHQIRAQFAHVKCPLKGDGKYGKSDGTDLALRAIRLGFHHPITKKWMVFGEK